MRNYVIWSIALLATVGTACNKSPEKASEQGKTTGVSESMKTSSQPLDRGQVIKPSEQGNVTQEVGAGGKTEISPKELTLDLGGGVKMDLVLIPAGEFMMGDEKGVEWENPVHKVIITKPFYLGKYEVTQEQWETLMDMNPSVWSRGPKNPVDSVSWIGCKHFVAKMNEKFRTENAKFNLPTEAQWEYACRAGTTTRYIFGDDAAILEDYAWWRKNAAGTTHPVGQKKPNAWDLYDMHGNVWEHCADWFDDTYYRESPTENPVCSHWLLYHVVRGGSSFDDDPDRFRCATRGDDNLEYRFGPIGFRVARTLTP
jgi:formylglycine-generating enzyme required for sulfatase activity